MKKPIITLPLLNLITLDEETEEILGRQEKRKKSAFIREAILNLAISHGYWPPNSQPVYIPGKKWAQVQEAENKNRSVDYSYVIAYYWLKALPMYSYRQKSQIVREAIIQWSNRALI